MTTLVWPTLGYRDARAAIGFLVTALGFQEVVVYDGETPEEVRHAELRGPGGGIVTLHSAEPNGDSVADLAEHSARHGGYPAYSIHIGTDEPDALFARAIAAGAQVVRDLGNSPLGTRGFIVRDPEGLHWSVGTALPRLVRDGPGDWRVPREASAPRTDLDATSSSL